MKRLRSFFPNKFFNNKKYFVFLFVGLALTVAILRKDKEVVCSAAFAQVANAAGVKSDVAMHRMMKTVIAFFMSAPPL